MLISGAIVTVCMCLNGLPALPALTALTMPADDAIRSECVAQTLGRSAESAPVYGCRPVSEPAAVAGAQGHRWIMERVR